MNKIYKVIWNRARGVYAVVSEMAKARGKASSTGLKRTALLAAAVLLLGGAFVPQTGIAAKLEEGNTSIRYDDNGIYAGATEGRIAQNGYEKISYALDKPTIRGIVEAITQENDVMTNVKSTYDGKAGTAETWIQVGGSGGTTAAVTTSKDGTVFTQQEGRTQKTSTTIKGNTISTGTVNANTVQVKTLKDQSGNTVDLGDVAGMQAELAGKANANDVYTRAYADTNFATKNELSGKADVAAVNENKTAIAQHQSAITQNTSDISANKQLLATQATTLSDHSTRIEALEAVSTKGGQAATVDAVKEAHQAAKNAQSVADNAQNAATAANKAAAEAHQAAQDVDGKVTSLQTNIDTNTGKITALEQKTAKLTREKDAYGNAETAITETASSSDIKEGKSNDFQSKVGVTGRNTSIETKETITDTSTGKTITHESYGTYGSDIIYQGTQTWDEGKNKGTLSSMQIIGSGTVFDLNQYGDGGQLVSSASTRIAGDKITVSDDKGNKSRLSTDGLTVGGQNYEAAPAALMADGRLKAAGGKFTVDTDGKVNAKGLDAGGETISGVAAGTNDTDAVNVAQLKDESARLDAKLNRTNKEIDQVGAMSMAIAGLHPLSYEDGDARFQISAALGTYDGTQAVALGGFYHFNQDAMLSIGMTTDLADGDKFGANIGYTHRIGSGGAKAAPAAPATPDVSVLLEKIEKMEARQAELETRQAQLEEENRALREAAGK